MSESKAECDLLSGLRSVWLLPLVAGLCSGIGALVGSSGNKGGESERAELLAVAAAEAGLSLKPSVTLLLSPGESFEIKQARRADGAVTVSLVRVNGERQTKGDGSDASTTHAAPVRVAPE